ncbi:hypothetical protein JFV29_14910 [Peribacillus sp. TH16]|nr:hypothetical protein [Peribacillus sp. TH16]MBK5483154.1 hypothetical protein [Peribacillus sp. TH16]
MEQNQVDNPWKSGEITAVKAITNLGLKKTTFLSWLKNTKEILKIA